MIPYYRQTKIVSKLFPSQIPQVCMYPPIRKQSTIFRVYGAIKSYTKLLIKDRIRSISCYHTIEALLINYLAG